MSGRTPYFVRPRMDIIEWLAVVMPVAATGACALLASWFYLVSG